MAKKKEDQAEGLSQAELEEKFGGESEEAPKKEEKKIKIKTKTTFSLADYKKSKGADDVKFKPQTWIKMSPAFQSVTALPGIPCNSITVCHGRSNSGKSTMALELAKYAQEQDIIPVFIITEKKWSWDRCTDMGIDPERCIVNTNVDFIEEGCDKIEEFLKDQEEGRLPHDIVFIWDSIGSTPSKKEFEAAEEGGGGGGMMLTARVLRERISRRIFHKINNTRKEDRPYNATLFVVNQSYLTPPSFAGGQPSITAYGGEGLTYSASIIFRMGGVLSSASKVKATKDGVQLSFAIKTALVVEKNHVTNVSPDGKVLCTAHGFIPDTKEAIEEYKKNNKDGWSLEFDKDWDKVSKD
jgi:RecA/RadA recombinase